MSVSTEKENIVIISTFLDQNVDKLAKAKDDKPIVMICGTIPVVPKDSLAFIPLTSISQLIDHDVASLECFMVDEVSSMIVEMCDRYSELFNFQLVLVTGVPECVYSPRLEQSAYRLARVPYHSVINGIREAGKMADLVDAEKARSSIYNKEQSGITRKGGGVKGLRAFDAPSMSVSEGDSAIESDPSAEDEPK